MGVSWRFEDASDELPLGNLQFGILVDWEIEKASVLFFPNWVFLLMQFEFFLIYFMES